MKEVTLKILYIGKISDTYNRFCSPLGHVISLNSAEFAYQGTTLDRRHYHDFSEYHRVYCAPIEYYFDNFKGEKLELSKYDRILIHGDETVGKFTFDCDIENYKNNVQTIITECYFIDNDCKIIDNKFNDHLKANIGFYNMIYIASDTIKIDCTKDFVDILDYLKDYPNVYLQLDQGYYCDKYHLERSKYKELLSYKTTDIYNNDYVSKIPIVVSTLPTKLIDVLGLNETYSELAKLQLENEMLNSRIKELESKLKSQSELEDEIAKMRKKLDVVKGLFS